MEDPAKFAADPEKARKAVKDAFYVLQRRIQLFISLPIKKLDRLALQAATRDIGETS